MIHILAGDAAGDVESVLQSGVTGKPLQWIVPKKAHATDRALFHLPGRGFAARGVIGCEPREFRSGRYTATVREIVLLASAVPLAFVREHHPAWKWPTYPRSYTTIDGSIEKRLEELLTVYQTAFAKPLTEGGPRAASVTVYERNPIARQRCIDHYGPACHGCGFSFGETYGETVGGYIHVHHLEALSNRGGKRAVDPVKDLRPICPNCHAVVHLQTPPLSIIELKRMLKRRRSPG
ncbi:MAG: HNH endonuclease [Candidatus Solibacter sp.]|nr:HNH endonuclease [Candidatus Solibacter sp.]MCX6925740.1 HNH endonuclease [Verrucomicrobiota bacterium]